MNKVSRSKKSQIPSRYQSAAVVLSLTGLATLAPATASAALVTYDDFGVTYIQPSKWYGEEGKQYGGIRVEAQRAIVDGQLRIQAKAYSDNYSNLGTSTTRNSVVFMKSEGITDIRASVTVRSIVAQACAGNTTPSIGRARLFGFFFNAGTPIPGSNYNDIYAGIQIYRASNSTDASGVLRLSGFIGQCTDDNCIGSNILASTDMGAVTTSLNTANALQVTWDSANNRFLFQRNSETAIPLTYTVADTNPASFPVKRLEISNQVAHCSASRPAVSMTADFDSVQTNSLTGLAVKPLLPAFQQGAFPQTDPLVGRVD